MEITREDIEELLSLINMQRFTDTLQCSYIVSAVTSVASIVNKEILDKFHIDTSVTIPHVTIKTLQYLAREDEQSAYNNWLSQTLAYFLANREYITWLALNLELDFIYTDKGWFTLDKNKRWTCKGAEIQLRKALTTLSNRIGRQHSSFINDLKSSEGKDKYQLNLRNILYYCAPLTRPHMYAYETHTLRYINNNILKGLNMPEDYLMCQSSVCIPLKVDHSNSARTLFEHLIANAIQRVKFFLFLRSAFFQLEDTRYLWIQNNLPPNTTLMFLAILQNLYGIAYQVVEDFALESVSDSTRLLVIFANDKANIDKCLNSLQHSNLSILIIFREVTSLTADITLSNHDISGSKMTNENVQSLTLGMLNLLI